MTRKTFLASIVSLGALALKPSAFVAAVRKLLKSEPVPMNPALRMQITNEALRALSQNLSFHRGAFFTTLEATRIKAGDQLTIKTPSRYAAAQYFDPTQVRIIG